VAIRIICSWKVLFRKAGEVGQARLRYKAALTDENKKLLDEAIASHDDYRDLCLEADEMIHFPDLSNVRSA